MLTITLAIKSPSNAQKNHRVTVVPWRTASGIETVQLEGLWLPADAKKFPGPRPRIVVQHGCWAEPLGRENDGRRDGQLQKSWKKQISGWWFGTFFSHMLGIIIPIDELIFFRGVERWSHQPENHGRNRYLSRIEVRGEKQEQVGGSHDEFSNAQRV